MERLSLLTRFKFLARLAALDGVPDVLQDCRPPDSLSGKTSGTLKTGVSLMELGEDVGLAFKGDDDLVLAKHDEVVDD